MSHSYRQVSHIYTYNQSLSSEARLSRLHLLVIATDVSYLSSVEKAHSVHCMFQSVFSMQPEEL